MFPHGNSIISGATTEQKGKRSSCSWPIPQKLVSGGTTSKPCGSEERLFNVKGSGKYTSRPRDTPVCAKHLPEAWKAWGVDSANPI
jgi:hypothetical protein